MKNDTTRKELGVYGYLKGLTSKDYNGLDVLKEHINRISQ
jgi:hypothetical protein